MKVLVTGGAGYIGSIASHFLAEKGFETIVVDDLSLGHRQAVPAKARFYRQSLLEKNGLNRIFEKEKPEAVFHFAAFSIVPESIQKPVLYYQNNVGGAANLLEAMQKNGCQKIVFSSTASVYGNPTSVPIEETAETKPINPYGRTKLWIEQMIADAGLESVFLRYFNAAGAAFGVGESHSPETHLIPLVLKTAKGERKSLSVFGTHYPTKDGTCIRDYVHVLDIAKAHELALEYLKKEQKSGCFNLGTEKRYSVTEIIQTTEKITKKTIPIENASPRKGDPAVLVASNQKARKKLGWKPEFGLGEIIESAWHWEQNKKF